MRPPGNDEPSVIMPRAAGRRESTAYGKQLVIHRGLDAGPTAPEPLNLEAPGASLAELLLVFGTSCP